MDSKKKGRTLNSSAAKSKVELPEEDYKRQLIKYLRHYVVIQLVRYCHDNDDRKVTIVQAIEKVVMQMITDGRVTNFNGIEIAVTKMITKQKELDEHKGIEEEMAWLYLAKHGTKVGGFF